MRMHPHVHASTQTLHQQETMVALGWCKFLWADQPTEQAIELLITAKKCTHLTLPSKSLHF